MKINYKFENTSLLKRALTHGSVDAGSYERLEFLGDAVLNLVISNFLYHKYPNHDEGKLTSLRSKYVKKDTLAKVARIIEVEGSIKHCSSITKVSDSLLSDVVEALVGSIFLDSTDLDLVAKLIMQWYEPLHDDLNRERDHPRSLLQIYLQERKLSLPEYKTIPTKDKKDTFTVSLYLPHLKKTWSIDHYSVKLAKYALAKMAFKYLTR